MFIEGETSTEMFILRSGKVRILKQEGDNAVELAVLGPGSVLGELSLLDRQPRGATAQVIEETVVTVIDEKLLEQTLQAVPNWLSNIIQLVVARLRTTMKRASDDIVAKSMGGIIHIMLLLYRTDGLERDSERRLPVKKIKEAVVDVMGIGEMEMENALLQLIFKSLLFIRNDAGAEFCILRNPEALTLYRNFLRARMRAKPMPGQNLPAGACSLIDAILQAGESNGRRLKEKIIRVSLQQVSIALSKAGKDRHCDLDSLDTLAQQRIIVLDASKTETSHGVHKQQALLYNEDTLRQTRLLQQWLPVFEENIIF
jgi:CRP/FNR family transcriptional regulator, cyclic AMP receptor protein